MHCLIFDIGKTNKKAFVFDEAYHIVYEETIQLSETTDDDGDICEDAAALAKWVQETATRLLVDVRFQIQAVNCTTYGASFVHLDKDGQFVTPLYNYLKPFPADLQVDFVGQYGGAAQLSLETATPLMGHLNAGLQLLWLKRRKPALYAHIHQSLHLPQWIAKILTEAVGKTYTPCSEMTSIGCHTLLWDFQKNDYHHWVKAEGIHQKLPPLTSKVQHRTPNTNNPKTGIGLHDSSAALIPYLHTFSEQPFVLISTGTWCISLNPFNDEPLTPDELTQDCLCYLTFEGKPVKAARYFGGHEHDEAVRHLAIQYGTTPNFYKEVGNSHAHTAYADFMHGMVQKQVHSTLLAIGKSKIQRIFVDGGFSHNPLYMRGLAAAFPKLEVCAASVAQATALGAALHIHHAWNTSVPNNLIQWKPVDS